MCSVCGVRLERTAPHGLHSWVTLEANSNLCSTSGVELECTVRYGVHSAVLLQQNPILFSALANVRHLHASTHQ